MRSCALSAAARKRPPYCKRGVAPTMAMERGLSILWIACICGSVQISMQVPWAVCLPIHRHVIVLGGPGEGAALTFRERDQGVVDAPVDLEALAPATRALAIRALAGDADLVDAFLPRRRLDHGDLCGQRATIVFQWNEQIGLECNEEVPGAILVGRPGTEHAERVHRERQRVALVPAKGQDRAAPRGRRVRGGAAVVVDRRALRQRGADAVRGLEVRAHERGGCG